MEKSINDLEDLWTTDADNIDFSKIDIKDIEKYIVLTPQIEQYLQVGHADRKLIVVAPKGLGKTLLLKVKSRLYNSPESSYKCIPSGGNLVEKLVTVNKGFSAEELNRFKEREIWEQLWELSISTLILKNSNIKLPYEIEQILGSSKNLFDIVRNFLNSRQALVRLYENNISRFLSPEIGALGPTALFIDNIDEGLGQHSGESLKKNFSKGTVHQDVWVNAQVGLMHVVRNMCSTNKHLKIFASVRSEAANCDDDPTSRQLRMDYCIDLEYTKSQIRKIFERTIKKTPSKFLKLLDSKDPITSFVGFSKIEHKFAKEENNNLRIENTFDFIYRHTFGRPRDIISMGKVICDLSLSERTMDAVRERINKESNDLLEGYKLEIVPYFKDDIFNHFCELTDKNVISYRKRQEISNQLSEQGFNNTFAYLYSLGLIGAIETDIGANREIQSFLPVGQYSFSKRSDPKSSKYFVIHSSVDKTLKDIHGEKFYDKNNIIGNGYEFNMPSNEKVLHVHFGLTKDSLSLVIPEMVQNKAVAVYQESSQEFHEFADAEDFLLYSNIYEPIHFKVISTKTSESQVKNILECWKKGDNILVYNYGALLPFLITECQTVTLEGKNTLPNIILPRVENSEHKKILYLSQRFIHKNSLETLKKQLENSELGKLFSIETSLIDRLTLNGPSKDESNKDKKKIIYRIESEKYGRIICRKREGSENIENNVIKRTKSKEEQDFYELRQKLLGEGTYRLTKIIKSELRGKEKNNINIIYKIFFDIQIASLLKIFRKDVLQKFFNHASETDIVNVLLRFCNDSKERFIKMDRLPSYTNGIEKYVEEAKKLSIFPTDKIFYEQVTKSNHYTNNSAVRKLQNLLDIKPLSGFRSVFISFTEKDKDFAKKVSDCLKKRGVDTYFYPEDFKHGEKKRIEEKEIRIRDRILPVVSQNFLKSEECHQELSLGIEKRQSLIATREVKGELEDVFIPITLDGLIISKDLEKVETFIENNIRDAKEAILNVKIIRDSAISDFSGFQKKKVDKLFEKKINNTIMPALKKYSGRRSSFK